MSLKTILAVVFFAGVILYFALLNPQDVEIHFTQHHATQLPAIAVIFLSALLGILTCAVMYWIGRIGNRFRRFRYGLRLRRRAKQRFQLDTLLVQAESAAAGGDWSTVAGIAQKILDRKPDHPGGLLRLGDALRRQGNPDAALKLHEQGRDTAPDDLRFLYAIAEDHSAAGRVDRQIETLERIRSLQDNCPDPLFQLRDIHLALRDWARAILAQQTLIGMLRDTRDRNREQKRLGEILSQYALDLYEKSGGDAVSAFEEAIREHPTLPLNYVLLGDLHARNNDDKSALKTWKAGFDTTLEPVFLQRIQSVLESSGNHHKDIVRAYEAAIRMAPAGRPRQILEAMLGLFLLQNGQAREAVAVLENDVQGGLLAHHVLLTLARQSLLGEAANRGPASMERRLMLDKARQDLTREISKANFTSPP